MMSVLLLLPSKDLVFGPNCTEVCASSSRSETSVVVARTARSSVSDGDGLSWEGVDMSVGALSARGAGSVAEIASN